MLPTWSNRGQHRVDSEKVLKYIESLQHQQVEREHGQRQKWADGEVGHHQSHFCESIFILLLRGKMIHLNASLKGKKYL